MPNTNKGRTIHFTVNGYRIRGIFLPKGDEKSLAAKEAAKRILLYSKDSNNKKLGLKKAG